MFVGDLEAIDKLRADAVNSLEPHISGIRKLTAYAAQLVWMGGKFPIDVRSPHRTTDHAEDLKSWGKHRGTDILLIRLAWTSHGILPLDTTSKPLVRLRSHPWSAKLTKSHSVTEQSPFRACKRSVQPCRLILSARCIPKSKHQRGSQSGMQLFQPGCRGYIPHQGEDST